MGTIFKKTFTKPLPEGAEIITRSGQQHACWTDGCGRKRKARITTGEDGAERIIMESSTYTAKFRDGAGRRVEKATGCRDKAAALAKLAEFERRAEHVRSGILSPQESAVADQQQTPLPEHVDGYVAHLRVKGTSEKHRRNVAKQLARLQKECGFRRLCDLRREAVEKWMVQVEQKGMGARTRNTYRAVIVGFANWCVATDRLTSNPFKGLPQADVRSDRRRIRRAFTEDELAKLFDAARRRPLLDALTIRRGPRKGQRLAKLSDRTRRKLELLGLERSLIYKTMAFTGLRRGELASLMVGSLRLDGGLPHAVLKASAAKNREEAKIPLRADLVADLMDWLVRKLQFARKEAERAGRPIPISLPLDAPLFNVPRQMTRIFDLDLALAEIPKRDERGRTVDIHALRHTFASLLSKHGVSPRVAQAALRHSTIDLTMNVYTDPELLDVRGAVESLPSVSLPEEKSDDGDRGTGTDEV